MIENRSKVIKNDINIFNILWSFLWVTGDWRLSTLQSLYFMWTLAVGRCRASFCAMKKAATHSARAWGGRMYVFVLFAARHGVERWSAGPSEALPRAVLPSRWQHILFYSVLPQEFSWHPSYYTVNYFFIVFFFSVRGTPELTGTWLQCKECTHHVELHSIREGVGHPASKRPWSDSLLLSSKQARKK